MRAVQPIRVLLVDESIVTLRGLQILLSTSKRLAVVGTASSEAEALAALEKYKPDIVVLEVQVRGANGITLCRLIREQHPEIVVVMFSVHDSKELLHDAILAGAQGYLLKSASREAIIKSLETVSAGQAVMDHHLTPQVMAWVREIGDHPSTQSKEKWVQDDVQLLALIAQGNTNKEIAHALGITRGTVSTRLQKIYRRLKISRRSEAASYFIQRGFEVSQPGEGGDQGREVQSKWFGEKRTHSRSSPDS